MTEPPSRGGESDPTPAPGAPIRGRRLTADFFDRPVLEVAPDLLGCFVAHAGVTVRLTEVEAYDGPGDPGSHAYRGVTARTAVMAGPPGGLYVYFTYGMHYCANLVCGPVGKTSAVLLRAGEVIDGVALARQRRSAVARRMPDRDLARGPARLAQALGLGRSDNGTLTVAQGSPVQVLHGPAGGPIRVGPRVGVAGPGGDHVAFPWRFWLDGEPTVSAYRPAVRRRRNSPPGPERADPADR